MESCVNPKTSPLPTLPDYSEKPISDALSLLPVRSKTTKDYRRHAGFLGVDGEGCRDADGNENYWLLRCGDRQIVAEPGERLTTGECLEFLFDCKQQGKFMVGFALNYDWD